MQTKVLKASNGILKEGSWLNVGCYPTKETGVLKAVYMKRNQMHKTGEQGNFMHYILDDKGKLKEIPHELEHKILFFDR